MLSLFRKEHCWDGNGTGLDGKVLDGVAKKCRLGPLNKKSYFTTVTFLPRRQKASRAIWRTKKKQFQKTFVRIYLCRMFARHLNQQSPVQLETLLSQFQQTIQRRRKQKPKNPLLDSALGKRKTGKGNLSGISQDEMKLQIHRLGFKGQSDYSVTFLHFSFDRPIILIKFSY